MDGTNLKGRRHLSDPGVKHGGAAAGVGEAEQANTGVGSWRCWQPGDRCHRGILRRSPKSETRNPKQIPITKIRMTQTPRVFVSDFDIRISNLFRISSFGFRIFSARAASLWEALP